MNAPSKMCHRRRCRGQYTREEHTAGMQALALLEAVAALPEDAPPAPQVWPKVCRCCEASHSEADWNALQLKGYSGRWQSNGTGFAVELRNCACGSTLGIEGPFPGQAQP